MTVEQLLLILENLNPSITIHFMDSSGYPYDVENFTIKNNQLILE